MPAEDGAGRVPWRTCVACRRRRPQAQLVRFHRTDHGIECDRPGRRAPGRGAYLCGNIECWELAVKRRSFQRSLRSGDAALDQGSPPPALVGMIANSPRGSTGAVRAEEEPR